MDKASSAPQLVVIGASAGGIDALSTLISALPADFPAPIVIAQHVDPTRISHLREIFARSGQLPVRTVTACESLKAGVIFVVPANRDIEINDREVCARGHPGNTSKPSVDRLLESAAAVYGDKLIAVILTGTGSDGTAGARFVKAAGGTVIIQNPDTASFPGMPRSLAPTTVDFVADLPEIGRLLTNLVSGDLYVPAGDEAAVLEPFLEQVRKQCGIDFGSYKMPTIMRRLNRRMAATGQTSINEYIRYLRRNPEEYSPLISSFLIKVTEFFRDPELFQYLREQILPRLIEYARAHGNELRFWSAGCATGEEAYSLAILISEVLGDELDHFDVRIFATDLDAEAVSFGRRGLYPASAVENLPPELISRYFLKIGDDYEIRKQVRNLVIFGQHDLGQRSPFPRIDLILCRNVLIYFTKELQKRALQLFAFSLRDGGYLVLGKTETVSPIGGDYFTLEQPQFKIYHRHGDRMLIPPARTPTAASAIPRPPTPVRFPNIISAQRGQQPITEQGHVPAVSAEYLLLKLPIGVVVVDRRYDIQTLNNAARRLFGIHGTAIGEDFIHLTQRLPSSELRAMIDAAFDGERRTALFEIEGTTLSTDEPTYLEVTTYSQEVDEKSAVVILATDATDLANERRERNQEILRQQQEMERLEALSARLSSAHKHLLEANQDLSTSNAELRTLNEEYMVSHEEAQAALEEVETLNEEMQAANEELETLNEELQATVEELDATNEDLQARSVELEDLAVSLEEQRRASDVERSRLEAILASMSDAVLVVNRAGEVVLTNAAYDRMFGQSTAGLVQEDEHGQPLPLEATLEQRAARGETFSTEFTITSPDGTPHWFEAIGRPIQGGDDDQAGVVIIRDVTDRSLQRLQSEFLAKVSHELRSPMTIVSASLQRLVTSLGGQGDERAHHYATLAFNQTQRLTGLVRDLSEVSRSQNGKLNLTLVKTDLAPLVTQMVEIAQTLTQGQTIHLDIADEPLLVNGDAKRIEQVLLNLLTNAINYAPGTERIDVRLRRMGGEALIDVQDYGPGIAAHELHQVFSRFYQGQNRAVRGGLGLGLDIAQAIVTEHGGRIDVHSVVGEGSTFTVHLPLLDESEEPTAEAGT